MHSVSHLKAIFRLINGLIFFRVAQMMLCFGFLMKAVVTTHWCFHSCRAVPTQSFSASHTALPARSWEVPTRTSDPGWPESYPIPCGIMLSSESREKGRGKEDVQSDGIHLPKKLLSVMSTALLAGAEYHPADGKWWINSLVSLSMFAPAFALPRELPLPQPMSSHVYCSNSLSTACAESKWASVQCWAACQG